MELLYSAYAESRTDDTIVPFPRVLSNNRLSNDIRHIRQRVFEFVCLHAPEHPFDVHLALWDRDLVALDAGRDLAVARRVVEQAALRLGDETEAPALIKAALQELGR